MILINSKYKANCKSRANRKLTNLIRALIEKDKWITTIKKKEKIKILSINIQRINFMGKKYN